jgi:hypothetical protein
VHLVGLYLKKKNLSSCSNCCSWWVFWAKLIWNNHDVPHRFFSSTSVICNCAFTWLPSHQHQLQPLLSLHNTLHKNSNNGSEIMPRPLPSRSWDSSVSIVARPWAGQSRNHGLKPTNGRLTSQYSMGTGDSLARGITGIGQADRSPPNGSKIKNAWKC